MRQEDMRKLNFNALRSGQREQAVQEVKAAMILDKIANQENIQVTDEELDNEIQVLAAHTNEDYHALRSRLAREGSLERIRERMRNEKTLNHLLQR
jgi:trigger factor